MSNKTLKQMVDMTIKEMREAHKDKLISVKHICEEVKSPHINLFFPYEILVYDYKNKRTMELSIEAKDFNDIPDCKIGHFGYNFYSRPAKAINNNFKGYDTTKQFLNACIRNVQSKGFIYLGWVVKD